MARFDSLDLSKLPPPAVVEQLDFEAYLAAFKTDFTARAAASGFDYDVESLESDPVVKVLEVAAYRETLLRALVNDKARAVMLALSLGTDLDNLGALYKTARALVTPATSEEPAVYESDDRLRQRVQAAPEALSTCGPEGAYVYHAMRASPAVKDVAVWTLPGSGQVHVLPLVSTGNGLPSGAVLDLVRAAVMADDKRPLTDVVTVRAPTVTAYAINLTLLVKRGPDTNVIRTSAVARLAAYAAERHRTGERVYLSGIVAAAKAGGVENVTPVTPLADLVPAADQAFWCSGITVTIEVV